MTTDEIAVELKERTVLRKGLNKLRSEGLVPAVIHDHGKPSIHVSGDFLKLVKAYQQAGKHHPVQLKIGGKQQLAMIKDVDFEPAKHQLRHIVFQAIKQGEKVTADVPVVLTGEEIPAEKISLLVLTQLDAVEVEALPGDLPDQLEVDATVLAEVGDKIHVSDIKVPKGVEITTDPEAVIATVEMPKDQIAEADAAAAALAEDKKEVGEEETEAETPEAAAEEGAGTSTEEQ